MSALNLPSAWRSRNSRWACLLRCHFETLEVVDVPADECGERRCALLDANERPGVFQRYFAMFCPGEGRRTVRKGLVFLMNDRRAPSDPDHRRIARGAVRLLPSSYRCHGDL